MILWPWTKAQDRASACPPLPMGKQGMDLAPWEVGEPLLLPEASCPSPDMVGGSHDSCLLFFLPILQGVGLWAFKRAPSMGPIGLGPSIMTDEHPTNEF